MRTSPMQFEVMVEFMERNGDLNKLVDGPQGRLNVSKKWEELCYVLDLDLSGSSKPIEKWKKVWSDLKNNTKRKAAKIQAASGTGGGPAPGLVLTDLEQRVLNLMGLQRVLESPCSLRTNQNIAISERVNMPEKRSKSTSAIVEDRVTSRTPHKLYAQIPTSRRHSPLLPDVRRRKLRRRAQRQRVDATSEQFLTSDLAWRNLATEFVAENVRLHERQLQQQDRWQNLFDRALDILERFMSD